MNWEANVHLASLAAFSQAVVKAGWFCLRGCASSGERQICEVSIVVGEPYKFSRVALLLVSSSYVYLFQRKYDAKEMLYNVRT